MLIIDVYLIFDFESYPPTFALVLKVDLTKKVSQLKSKKLQFPLQQCMTSLGFGAKKYIVLNLPRVRNYNFSLPVCDI